MFEHFGQRLKRDLKQLVDRRISASEVASGSLQRVSIYCYTSIKTEIPVPVFWHGSQRHFAQEATVRLLYVILITLAHALYS